jgi:hypothetical protein
MDDFLLDCCFNAVYKGRKFRISTPRYANQLRIATPRYAAERGVTTTRYAAERGV